MPVGAGDTAFLQNVQTGTSAYPASYSVGTGVLSRGKSAGKWCWPLTV